MNNNLRAIMKLFIILLFIITFSFAGDKKLNSKPVKKDAVTLTNPIKVVDLEDGFYEEVNAAVAPNGKIFVYDVGNKLVHRFSKDGAPEFKFGKEGNGPGEFNRGTRGVFASNNRVFIQHFAKLMIFKYDGTLVKEIKSRILALGQHVFHKNSFELILPPNQFSNVLKAEYDYDGNLIKETKNKGFKQQTRPPSPEEIINRITRPQGLGLLSYGYVQSFPYSTYKIQIIDKSYNVKDVFTKEYERIKYVNEVDRIPRRQRPALKNATGQRKQFMMNIVSKIKEVDKGFISDVMQVMGTQNDYIFLRTSAKKTSDLNIDVISPDMKYYSQISIPANDEIISTYVSEKHLVVNYTNEDDGPYSVVYDMTIN